MKPSDQKITKTAGENSYSKTRNETFNNIPEEQEISDEDTIVYTSGSNEKPLPALIENEGLSVIVLHFY